MKKITTYVVYHSLTFHSSPGSKPIFSTNPFRHRLLVGYPPDCLSRTVFETGSSASRFFSFFVFRFFAATGGRLSMFPVGFWAERTLK